MCCAKRSDVFASRKYPDDKPRLRDALALAACALLPAGTQAAEGGSTIDIAVLDWSEQDRVSALEPVIGLRTDLGDDRSLSVQLVLDSLSGASHNGANVQPAPQTFSAASGGAGGYTVPAGAVPLDPGFEDERTAVSVGYETPLANPLWKMSLGANVSKETDYLSLGASSTLSRDFNKRNTTVLGGLSVTSDAISPNGGAPEPFALVVSGGGGEPGEGGEGGEEGEGGEGGGAATPAGPAEHRRIVDVMLGLTQVINRTTLMQFNVAMSAASGYMNDPYKIVTVDSAPLTYVHENRPDSRQRLSFYAGARHAFASGNILDTGYRYMTDDWGVQSQTLDVYYRIMLPGNWYIEPHARAYTQTAADFFTMSIAPANLPAPGSKQQYASGDYRLGRLEDMTYGARIGHRFGESSEIYVRAEQFTQSGDWKPAEMNATILEIGGSWSF